MNKLLFPILFIFAALVTGCSDDEPNEPTNFITINMMDSNNGRTILGESDVYINSADNFVSPRNCFIADLGRNGSLSSTPDPNQMSREVAVTPGHYYQILPADQISEVAGKRAFRVGSQYYNARVESWITDKDNDIIGARVSYLECTPKPGILPEWSTNIDIRLRSTEYYDEGAYTFSKGTVIDRDYNISGSDLANSLEITITDNTIRFVNRSRLPSSSAEVSVLVRHENVYSRVHFTILN